MIVIFPINRKHKLHNCTKQTTRKISKRKISSLQTSKGKEKEIYV